MILFNLLVEEVQKMINKFKPLQNNQKLFKAFIYLITVVKFNLGCVDIILIQIKRMSNINYLHCILKYFQF